MCCLAFDDMCIVPFKYICVFHYDAYKYKSINPSNLDTPAYYICTW